MWEGLVHCGLCHLGQVVKDCIRKHFEQAMRTKLVSSAPPWCLLQFLPGVFLPWLSSTESDPGYVSQMNTFLTRLLLVIFFITGIENKQGLGPSLVTSS